MTMTPDNRILYRTFTLDRLDIDGRTVTGLAVPFDQVADVVDLRPDGTVVKYREVFRPGSFDNAVKVPHRVTYVYSHSDSFGERLGHATAFEQTDRGLEATFRLDESRAPQARDAIMSSHGALSIGFVSLKPKAFTERPGALVERKQVHLVHVAAVPQGAYSDALVTSVRADVEAAEAEVAAEDRATAEATKAESDRLMASIDQVVGEQDAWKERLGYDGRVGNDAAGHPDGPTWNGLRWE